MLLSSIGEINAYISSDIDNNPNENIFFKHRRVFAVVGLGVISGIVAIPASICIGVALSVHSCVCCITDNIKSFFDKDKPITAWEIVKNIFTAIVIDFPLVTIVSCFYLFKDITFFLILRLINKPTFTYTKKFLHKNNV